jgi:SAM-dependent methyltransferase
MLGRDAEYFLELQTKTGWGRTLSSFAEWCAPKPGWFRLDVGCGPGLLPAILSDLGCRAVGVDLDLQMFDPAPLYPIVVVGNANNLPFLPQCFDLITAVNLLFLLDEPTNALSNMKQFLKPGGKLAMLNPSELLNEQAACLFANERGLEGMARETLINWARRAANNQRWTEKETYTLYYQAGMRCIETELRMGLGFARFSWGMV